MSGPISIFEPAIITTVTMGKFTPTVDWVEPEPRVFFPGFSSLFERKAMESFILNLWPIKIAISALVLFCALCWAEKKESSREEGNDLF